MLKSTIATLNEFDGSRLLQEAGIPVIQNVMIKSADDAVSAAEQLGFPVALKICAEAVLHKTERGGVVLNIANATELEIAARKMTNNFFDIPHALLIQKMAVSGMELLLGARRDPVFGPIVLAGFGGIFTEIFRDTAIALAPVDEKTACALLRRLKGAALLNGYRSQEPLDIKAIACAIASLSRLMVSRRDIWEVDINPLIACPDGVVAVDALVRLSASTSVPPRKWRHLTPSSIAPFFIPSSIAVIGASRTPGKGGNIILRNLLKAGFKGDIYPVNPTVKEILGLAAFPGVGAIPRPVELAMVVIPKNSVPDALADCQAKGITNIILSTGGYSDIGEEGSGEQKALVERAQRGGIRIMGPNSIGTINPAAGMATSIVGLDQIQPGGVSIIGQSGVFASGWARWIADTKPFGLAKVACIGNKGDVNESDLLEYLTQDAETKTIGMYLEGIVEGERFIKAAFAACRAKPVVVMKAGRSKAGAAAAASHTGALAGSDAVFDAVCRKTGLMRTYNSEAFFDSLAAFEKLPLPAGNRLGALSITGMGCVAATDAAEEYDIILPALQTATLRRLSEVMPSWAPVRNPIDTWSAIEQHGAKKATSHIARCLLEQPDVDALLITFVLMPESIFDIPEAFAELFRQYPSKPVLASYYGGTAREISHIREGFAKLGIPCYPTPERAIFSFSRLVEYARFRLPDLSGDAGR